MIKYLKLKGKKEKRRRKKSKSIHRGLNPGPFTAIFTPAGQGKNLQDISATQLLDLDTRTTEILSFKKICGAVFEIDRFKVFPLVNFTRKKG